MFATNLRKLIFIASFVSLVFLNTGCALLVPALPDTGGYVLAVEADEVLIDLTNRDGITKGNRLIVLRRDVNDKPMKVLGEIVITQVESKLSRGKLVAHKDQIYPGDLVRTKPKSFTDVKQWQVPTIQRRNSTQVSGPLAFDEVWNGTIHVSGDVTVPAGVTLQIEPGTQVIFAESDDRNSGEYPDLCELIIDGRLLAIGTANDKITFTPSKPVMGVSWRDAADRGRLQKHQQWGGINLISPDRHQIQHCEILNAAVGIALFRAPDSLIEFNKIHNCHRGIDAQAIVHVSNNNIQSSRYGIRVREGTVSDNTIKDCMHGIDVGQKALPLIVKNNIISKNEVGIHGRNSTLEIIGNTITGNNGGIVVEQVKSIRGNRILHNNLGIALRNSASDAIIANNTLTDNKVGVACLPPVIPNLGDLSNENPEDDGGNIFIRNGLNLETYSYPVKAEGNFWGSPNAKEIVARIRIPNETIFQRLPEVAVDFEPYRINQYSKNLSEENAKSQQLPNHLLGLVECCIDVSWPSWQSCEKPVWVNKGDVLNFHATGNASFGDISASPEGINQKSSVESLAPGLPEYSLVARIGLRGETFLVGKQLKYTTMESGYLYFGINETVGFTNWGGGDATGNYKDNDGYYNVRVGIEE